LELPIKKKRLPRANGMKIVAYIQPSLSVLFVKILEIVVNENIHKKAGCKGPLYDYDYI